MSKIYVFLLNLWINGDERITEAYLQNVVNAGKLTQEEMAMILATPQG